MRFAAEAAGTVAALSNPETLGTPTYGGGTELASDTVAPADGALVIVKLKSRDKDPHTHVAPSTTLANMTAWTLIDTVAQVDSTAPRYCRMSAWWARATGAPGPGTITPGASIPVFNLDVDVLQVAAGYDTADPIGAVGVNSNEAGTTLAVTLDNNPAADSVCIAELLQHGNDSSIGITGSFAQLRFYDREAVLNMATHYDMADAPTTVNYSSLRNGDAHLGLYFEVRKAA